MPSLPGLCGARSSTASTPSLLEESSSVWPAPAFERCTRACGSCRFHRCADAGTHAGGGLLRRSLPDSTIATGIRNGVAIGGERLDFTFSGATSATLPTGGSSCATTGVVCAHPASNTASPILAAADAAIARAALRRDTRDVPEFLSLPRFMPPLHARKWLSHTHCRSSAATNQASAPACTGRAAFRATHGQLALILPALFIAWQFAQCALARIAYIAGFCHTASHRLAPHPAASRRAIRLPGPGSTVRPVSHKR